MPVVEGFLYINDFVNCHAFRSQTPSEELMGVKIGLLVLTLMPLVAVGIYCPETVSNVSRKPF